MLITFNGTQFLWNQSCQKKRAQLKLLDLSLNNKTETLGKMVNGKEQYFLTTTTTYTLSLTQHLSQRPSNPMFFLFFFHSEEQNEHQNIRVSYKTGLCVIILTEKNSCVLLIVPHTQYLDKMRHE